MKAKERTLTIEDEQRLIARYQQTHDAVALSTLIRDNEPYLRGMTAKILGNETEWTLAVCAFADTVMKYRLGSKARVFTVAYLRIKRELLSFAYGSRYDGELCRLVRHNNKGTATAKEREQYVAMMSLRQVISEEPREQATTEPILTEETTAILSETEKAYFMAFLSGYKQNEIQSTKGITITQQNRYFDSIVAKLRKELTT